jgi:cyanoexosortase B-associated protein
MVSLPKPFQLSQTLKLVIVVFVLAIAALPVLPNYVTQNWSWQNPPDVPTLSQLRALAETGLTVPGWQSRDQQVVEISGKEWLVQTLTAPAELSASTVSGATAVLMLRPQTWHLDQPQVEWMDINGDQHWTVDRQQRLRFSVPSSQSTSNSARSVDVTARFFRGWSQKQTYAVLQWYAWSTSGSPAPSHWFWADQLAQWHKRQRMPWVAVSLLIPIQPLEEIEPAQPLAASLGETIQSALMSAVLTPQP